MWRSFSGLQETTRAEFSALQRARTVANLNATDPLAYIISANVHRRHMTHAQRAMALAMIAPEADEKGRGKTGKLSDFLLDEERGAMQRAIRKARLVLKYKPDLAAEVLSGMLALDAAYKQALETKQAAISFGSWNADASASVLVS